VITLVGNKADLEHKWESPSLTRLMAFVGALWINLKEKPLLRRMVSYS
jgi:hypothetical protein